MKQKIIKIYKMITEKEMGVLPGNLAYSFFLAIIPMLSLLFFIITSFNLPMDIIENFLIETFPEGVVDLLQPILVSKEVTANSIVTLVLGLVVATNGCNALIVACNRIFNIENASLLKRMIKSTMLTFCIILLFLFMMIVPLFGKSILTLIGTFTDFIVENETLVNTIYIILQVPVSLLVVFLFIKLVYTIAPDEHIPSKYVNRGALFTSVSWLVVTFAYSYYINNTARYDLVYGNLANIVILLLWFYVLAYIFVLGLYMNKKTTDIGIEETNTIKLEEIRKRVKEEKKKK